MTVDLRRYRPKGKADSVANFSSIEMVTYGTAVENDFQSTLDRVLRMTGKRKSAWLGLSAFVSAYPGLWAMPFSVLRIFVQKGMESKAVSPNAFDWFTNMGEIPAEQVEFGKPPSRAWLLPPGCNLPLLFYGCSGYAGTLSLSAGVPNDGDGLNASAVNVFFDRIISELPLDHSDEEQGPFNGGDA